MNCGCVAIVNESFDADDEVAADVTIYDIQNALRWTCDGKRKTEKDKTTKQKTKKKLNDS